MNAAPPGTPSPYFLAYFIVWALLALSSWRIIATRPNAAEKKKWSTRFSILGGILVGGFMVIMAARVSNPTPILFMVAFLVGIVWYNIRHIQFCPQCGCRVAPRPFTGIEYCSKCGAKLRE